MTLDDDFATAQERIKGLSRTPNTARLLDLYSLYKQATLGDVTGERPGALDFKGRAKYDAWSSRQGMDAAAAKQAYVDLAESLLAADG